MLPAHFVRDILQEDLGPAGWTHLRVTVLFFRLSVMLYDQRPKTQKSGKRKKSMLSEASCLQACPALISSPTPQCHDDGGRKVGEAHSRIRLRPAIRISSPALREKMPAMFPSGVLAATLSGVGDSPWRGKSKLNT